MKPCLLTLILLVISMTTSKATIRTVSNTPSTLAQFNTIQAAVNASSSGDTIQVHGSPNTYAAFTQTNKKLVMIGPGWSPTTANTHIAIVNGFTVQSEGSNDSEYHGLTFNSTININSNTLSGIRFIRNRFQSVSLSIAQGGVTYMNYLLEGNVFVESHIASSGGSTYQNFLFQNNYVYNSSGTFFTTFPLTNNFIINHNLFFGPSGGSSNLFSTGNGLIISNNIFVRREVNSGTSTFNDNITFLLTTGSPWTVNGNIDGGGNISNTNPEMVDQTNVNNGINNFLGNYTIAGGPANDAGSDGEDLGLLFLSSGSLNWTNSRSSRYPSVSALNIVSPVVGAGQDLNVNAEGRRNN